MGLSNVAAGMMPLAIDSSRLRRMRMRLISYLRRIVGKLSWSAGFDARRCFDQSDSPDWYEAEVGCDECVEAQISSPCV